MGDVYGICDDDPKVSGRPLEPWPGTVAIIVALGALWLNRPPHWADLKLPVSRDVVTVRYMHTGRMLEVWRDDHRFRQPFVLASRRLVTL